MCIFLLRQICKQLKSFHCMSSTYAWLILHGWVFSLHPALFGNLESLQKHRIIFCTVSFNNYQVIFLCLRADKKYFLCEEVAAFVWRNKLSVPWQDDEIQTSLNRLTLHETDVTHLQYNRYPASLCFPKRSELFLFEQAVARKRDASTVDIVFLI